MKRSPTSRFPCGLARLAVAGMIVVPHVVSAQQSNPLLPGRDIRLVVASEPGSSSATVRGVIDRTNADSIVVRLPRSPNLIHIARRDIRDGWYGDARTRRNGAIAGAKRGYYGSAPFVLTASVAGLLINRDNPVSSTTVGVVIIGGGVAILAGSAAVGAVKRSVRWKRLEIR